MITYYKTLNNRVKKIKQYEENCWINCITPDEDEIESLIDDFNIDPEFLKAALQAQYPDLKTKVFGAMQRLPLPQWGILDEKKPE